MGPISRSYSRDGLEVVERVVSVIAMGSLNSTDLAKHARILFGPDELSEGDDRPLRIDQQNTEDEEQVQYIDFDGTEFVLRGVEFLLR